MGYERERHTRVIYRIVDMRFDLDGHYDRCPPEDVNHKNRARLDDEVSFFLLADGTNEEIKDQALSDMFDRIVARSNGEAIPTEKDVEFLSVMTGYEQKLVRRMIVEEGYDMTLFPTHREGYEIDLDIEPEPELCLG